MTTPYWSGDGIDLYLGDCREHTEWLTADVLVTDPPYGNGHSSGREGGGASKFSAIPNDEDPTIRDTALQSWGARPALIFGTWKVAKPIGTHTVLIWDKGDAAGMGNLSIPWKPNWDEIYVIGHGFAGRRDTSILTGNRVVTWASKGREHPNQKPVALIERLLAKCPTGTVADPFAGSGSTLVAAKLQGRKAIGVELVEQYCEIAARRLDQGVLAFEDTA